MRKEWQEKHTRVHMVARPSGRNQDNPPNLDDLRRFVDLCEGLPGTTHVHITQGYLSEGGRHDITFKLEIIDKLEEEG